MTDEKPMTRREWLAGVFAGAGVLAAYGVLAAESLLFLLPRTTGAKTRRIFAGQINDFEIGKVRSVLDLQGNPILIRRTTAGFAAFSSTCPHLGCKVHWQEENQRFLCPCHMGIFDAEGRGISGPPGDAGQSLSPVPIQVDESGGVVYLEVADTKTTRKT
jgi:cytochrome b6-f complex iron-sulfur subunit